MGVAGGVRNLPWLFTATLLATLLVSPLFSLLVSRMPQRRFVAWSYRLLMLCLLLFYGALRSEKHTSELQSLMRISYAVFCLKKKKKTTTKKLNIIKYSEHS